MITIDYKGHPVKSLIELFQTYPHGNYLILDDVLKNDDTFSFVYQDMLDFLKYGIEYKEIREYPIHFVIHRHEIQTVDTKLGTEVINCHTLELRHFLSNMVMWHAFMQMERVDILDETFIIDWHEKNAEDIARYIDQKIIPYYENDDHGQYSDEKFHRLNAIVDEIIYHVKAISDAFSLIFGYSASIYDIMRAEEQNPEIHDIIYGHIDPTLQPKEMEDLLNAKNKRLIELFSQSDSDLRPLLKSGKNISDNQFKEIFLRIGFKADLSNRTIPWFIDGNLLCTGIDMASYYLIIAGAGRKAQIESKLTMSKPGALSKKMNHNATPVILRKDHEICDSARPVFYLIEDDAFLEMLDKRNYYDEHGHMHMLNYETDKHLIGKVLPFRSPCTCTSKEGVCEACYGGLFEINKDLFSPGSLAATMDTEKTGQLVLSQKHTQFTDSGEINFDDLFYQCFDIVSTEITLSDSNDDILSGLLINLGPVTVEETDDGDAYHVDYFDLVNYNGETVGRVQEQNGYPLYLASEMIVAWKQSAGHPIPVIRFNDCDDDAVLFNIEIKSKAVTQSLKLITDALDSKDHLGCSRDIDGLCQKFGRIMIDSGIMYPFVHHEMIIKSLMRKVGNELEYPDFSANGNHDDYEILRLTWSLRKNPSPVIRLCTGWLKSSLLSSSLYQARQPSHFDALFVPKLSEVI